MNDTWQTLVRAVLKIGAGYLLSKGLIDQSHSEEAISAITGAIAVLWGIVHRTPAPSSSATTGVKIPLMIIGLSLLAGLPGVLLVGCSTNAQKVTYQAVTASDAAVRVAMTGWGVHVAEKHPSTNTEWQVEQAFNTVKSAELAVIDATRAVASNPSATNALNTALIMEQAAQADLINLIGSLTNNPVR